MGFDLGTICPKFDTLQNIEDLRMHYAIEDISAFVSFG